MIELVKVTTVFAVTIISYLSNINQSATAYSVCGLKNEEASFRTNNYLITICLGKASYQGIVTYFDGTGYTADFTSNNLQIYDEPNG